MVGVLLLIDVVILAAWQIIDPLTVDVKQLDEKVSLAGALRLGILGVCC